MDNSLSPVPATPQTVARFLYIWHVPPSIQLLTTTYQLLISSTKYYGHAINVRNYFMIKLVLMGIKRRLGDAVRQMVPLSTSQILLMYEHLDISYVLTHAWWAAIILSFLLSCASLILSQTLCHGAPNTYLFA